MYELIQLTERTYYIKSPTNIGLFRLDEKNVCLIDETTADAFGGANPIGAILDVMGQPFTVIGVVSQKSQFEPVINSIQGMAIDVHTRKSRVAKPKGGLSGPLCHHIAVRMVWEVAQAVDIPINGVGGVMTGEDAAEFILAGATCVSVGMANFVDPCASLKIAHELEAWAESQGVKDINELVGAFEC